MTVAKLKTWLQKNVAVNIEHTGMNKQFYNEHVLIMTLNS